MFIKENEGVIIRFLNQFILSYESTLGMTASILGQVTSHQRKWLKVWAWLKQCHSDLLPPCRCPSMMFGINVI